MAVLGLRVRAGSDAAEDVMRRPVPDSPHEHVLTGSVGPMRCVGVVGYIGLVLPELIIRAGCTPPKAYCVDGILSADGEVGRTECDDVDVGAAAEPHCIVMDDAVVGDDPVCNCPPDEADEWYVDVPAAGLAATAED